MTNYERGFITKCAEHGVDPVELIKQAGISDIFESGKKKRRRENLSTAASVLTIAALGIAGAAGGRIIGKNRLIRKLTPDRALATNKNDPNRKLWKAIWAAEEEGQAIGGLGGLTLGYLGEKFSNKKK